MKRTKGLLAAMMLLLSFFSYAQPNQRSLAGVIKDEKGAPIEGITVTVKGTHRSTQTDKAGAFSIDAPKSALLVITGVGYEPQEIRGAGTDPIDVVLKTAATSMNDVIVVGYGSQKKAKVTGAISVVKMDEVLGERPVSTTASLLQGVTPGLQVTIPSGRPGEGASLNIRGATDFGTALNSSIATGSPLILMDNTVFDGPLNLIDPEDIETVTILKDAGSAAIYGARSAYGVILITTKKGHRNQKPQFVYSNNLVFASPTGLPQKASPARSLQALLDGGMTSYTVGQGQDLTKWINYINDYQKNPKNYPGGYVMDNGIFYNLKGNDAIADLLGGSAKQFMNNLSVSGGSENTTYRISLGSTNENGVLVPSAHMDNYKRYNIRSVIGSQITPWLNVQVDANYSHSVTTRPGYSDPYTYAVELPSFLAADSIPGYPGQIATGKNLVTNSYPTSYRYDQLRLAGKMTVTPFRGMTVTGEATYSNYYTDIFGYNKLLYLRDPYGWANKPFGNDQVTEINGSEDYVTSNLYATYTRTVQQHTFTLMGGFNQDFRGYTGDTLWRLTPINQAIPSIATATGATTGSDASTQFATRGYFGRFNYDFDGKYLLEVNGRYDGSSRFPPGHRWGFFPSASAGWRLMNERFMEFAKSVVNEFKLRASYGTVGNQAIPDYSYMATMTAYNPNWLNTSAPVETVGAPGLISPNFTWETVTTKDAGVSIGVLRNRLTADIDLYIRNTTGILSQNNTPVPAVLGTAAPLINSASLRSNGFEVEVTWRDKVGKVGYYISANVYDFTSVVTQVNNPNKILSQLYAGEKMGEIRGYTTKRFFTTSDFVPGSLDANNLNGKLLPGVPHLNNQAPNPGDIMYVDYDTTGLITGGQGTKANSGSQQIIGNSALRFQFGLRGGVSYHNFDFSFVITGVAKNQQFIGSYLYFPNNWQVYGALYKNQLNYWTPNNPNAFFGRIYTTTPNGVAQTYNEQVQSRFIVNGAYLRVRNMTLRYSVPASLLRNKIVNRLSIAYSIENPFIFDHLPKGIYPDLANLGQGLNYPLLMKQSIGLNVSF